MRQIVISLKDSELKRIAESQDKKATTKEIITDELVMNGILYEILNQAMALNTVGELG